MRWPLEVGMFVVFFVYVVIGGLVFWYLESIDRISDKKQQLPLTSSSEQLLTVASIQTELMSHVAQQLDNSSAPGLNCSP